MVKEMPIRMKASNEQNFKVLCINGPTNCGKVKGVE